MVSDRSDALMGVLERILCIIVTKSVFIIALYIAAAAGRGVCVCMTVTDRCVFVRKEGVCAC